MVRVPTQETNPEGGGGGKFVDLTNDAHLIIEKVESIVSGQKGTPGLAIEVNVLASTEPSQVGKKHTERFYLSGGGWDRFTHFCCATGLYSMDRWEKDKAAGIDAELDENALIGMQFCAPIHARPFGPDDERRENAIIERCRQAGDSVGIEKAEKRLKYRNPDVQLGGEKGFIFWGLGDAEAEHVPLDQASIAAFKNGLPTKKGGLRHRGQGPGPAASGAKPSPPAPLAPASAAPATPAAADLW